MENYIYYIIDLNRFYWQSLKNVTVQIILFNFQIENSNNPKSDTNFSSSNLMNKPVKSRKLAENNEKDSKPKKKTVT